MVIVRILIALINAILKVFADSFVAGGAVLIEFLTAVAVGVVTIWIIVLLAIAVRRRTRR